MQIGDRITSKIDGVKADILRISKDGKRLYISFWGRGIGEPKLMKMWVHASGWEVWADA